MDEHMNFPKVSVDNTPDSKAQKVIQEILEEKNHYRGQGGFRPLFKGQLHPKTLRGRLVVGHQLKAAEPDTVEADLPL